MQGYLCEINQGTSHLAGAVLELLVRTVLVATKSNWTQPLIDSSAEAKKMF